MDQGDLLMDRAIIIGAFGFVGFSVCQALLDEGIEVIAISVSEEPDLFTEEKRMEIGRNANFIEEERWLGDGENASEITPVIIPVYDYYIQEKESLLLEHPFLKEGLESLSPEVYSVTLLLPEQLGRGGASNDQEVIQLKNRLYEKGFSLKEILVPTLYGPRQPEVCYFQQMMAIEGGEKKVPTLNSRESVQDAIYITDATSEVIRLLEEAPAGKYIIRSAKDDSWLACLELIQNKLMLSADFAERNKEWLNDIKSKINSSEAREESQLLSNEINRILVQEPMDIPSGLKEQRKEYFRLLQEK